MDRYNLKKAHQYSSDNRKYLNNSDICGCFHCLRIFHPNEITEWLDEGSGTALCPHCGIDSVISDNCGFRVTDELLTEMYDYWFK